jgi:hypothetical protein
VCLVFISGSERVTLNMKVCLPSPSAVQLSKMWVGYGGTVCNLVISLCVSCADNDSVVLMIAEGNDNHVSVVLPV